MFNAKHPDNNICANSSVIFHGDCSYIDSVKWDDFIKNPNAYIENAYHLQNSIAQFNIYKEIN